MRRQHSVWYKRIIVYSCRNIIINQLQSWIIFRKKLFNKPNYITNFIHLWPLAQRQPIRTGMFQQNLIASAIKADGWLHPIKSLPYIVRTTKAMASHFPIISQLKRCHFLLSNRITTSPSSKTGTNGHCRPISQWCSNGAQRCRFCRFESLKTRYDFF
jgi:hypothetical protein